MHRRGVVQFIPAFRELLVGEKQWKEGLELTLERLSEIPVESRYRRSPTVTAGKI